MTTLTTLIINNTWEIHFQDCLIKNGVYSNLEDYIKNNFFFDHPDCTDYQDHLKNCFIIDYADYVYILTTLTTLIFNTTWKIVSSLITLTTLLWRATTDNKSSLTTLIFNSNWKIVINDYFDNPLLYITVTCTGILSRNFSVVLHASLVQCSRQLVFFYTLWKHQKTSGFLFLASVGRESWSKMG